MREGWLQIYTGTNLCFLTYIREMLITEAFYGEEGIKIGGEFITTIRYAHDTAVVATTAGDLQSIVKK